jgi:hypothetical protein
MSAGRQMRDPLPADQFNKLDLKGQELTRRPPYWNLRWSAHATPAKAFFASASGRLTPESETVPCLYLAISDETSFKELYGDDYDAAEKAGVPFSLSLNDAMKRAFLHTTEEIKVRVYDLARGSAAKKIGLDLGTLYAPLIMHTRAFAQRLHDHPAGFDGIRYRSRLMDTECFVLWQTRGLKAPALTMDSTLLARAQPDGTNPALYRLFGRATQLFSP